METYKNTKMFWINKNRNFANLSPTIKDNELTTKDWVFRLQKLDKLNDINNLGRQIRKEISKSRWKSFSSAKQEELKNSEEEELKVEERKDLLDLEKELEKLKLTKIENGVAKDMIDAYENSIKEFQNKIKSIIGNDLTNWETKIVKAGSNHKDITDLQKKNTNLITEKTNLEKELKKEKDKYLNHKCDTPNNNELNQLKEDLKKSSQEKEQLQIQLNQKVPNTPLPTPQQKEEEDKKEEQENQNLTAEELRAKLNAKQQEIRNLQKKLEKVKQNNSSATQNQNNKPETKFFSGMALAFSIAAVIGGIIYFLRVYKQKKKKKTVIDYA